MRAFTEVRKLSVGVLLLGATVSLGVPAAADAHSTTTTQSTTTTTATSTTTAAATGATGATGRVAAGRRGWQDPQLIEPPNGYVRAVSCVTQDFCMAVDDRGNAIEYDGSQWLPQTPTRGDDREQLVVVSCASITRCVAVDDTGRAVRYDGTTWSPLALPDGAHLSAISCVSDTFCMAGGWQNSNSVALVLDGTTWTRQWVLAETPSSISCVGVDFCVAVDYSDGAAVFDGSSWSDHQDFGAGELLSVSCVASHFCAASGNGRVVTFDGSQWKPVRKISGKNSHLSDVSCASDAFCVAVSGGKYSLYTSGHWSALTSFTDSQVQGIACLTVSSCLAVEEGRSSSYAVFDGHTWTQEGDMEGGGATGLQDVSCPTQTFCAAVDYGGYAMTYDGTSWSARARVTKDSLGLVSCPSPRFCLALAQTSGAAAVYDGTGWTMVDPLPGGELVAFEALLSCSSAHFCMVIGGNGSAYVYDGARWTHVADTHTASVLSCGSSTFCVIGGYYFDGVAIWDGSSFVPDPSYPLDYLSAVSCTPAHFCMAVGNGGQTVTYDATTWSAPHADGPHGVPSCPSGRFCAAANGQAQASLYKRGSWRGLTDLVPGHDAGSAEVSCASARFCMAVTFYGYAIAYR